VLAAEARLASSKAYPVRQPGGWGLPHPFPGGAATVRVYNALGCCVAGSAYAAPGPAIGDAGTRCGEGRRVGQCARGGFDLGLVLLGLPLEGAPSGWPAASRPELGPCFFHPTGPADLQPQPDLPDLGAHCS